MPFNVSSLAQKAATIAFGDDEFIEEIVRVNTEGLRQYEKVSCKENEIPFYQSQTNFIFLPVENGGEIYEASHTQDLLFVRSRMVSASQSEQGSKMKE